MLKLVKWAYSLGVRNERHRIAQYLQTAQAKRFDAINMFKDELRDRPVESKHDARKRNIEKRFIQKEVDKQIIDIIDGLFHGEERYVRGESIMFPNDKEEK